VSYIANWMKFKPANGEEVER